MKTSGLGDNFYFNGYDLSGDIGSVDQISCPLGLLDVSGVKQFAHSRISGQRDGQFKFTSFFENTPTIATPSVPLSTVAQVSTYNVPVYVTITGGTMTNVTINGTTVGTGAGTYVLPALGSITMTYSAAPTWNWVGLGLEHNALAPRPVTDVQGMYFRGTTLGNIAACVQGKQLSYDFTRDNRGGLTMQAEVDGNGFGMEWGIMLTAGLRTDTTATNGTSVDNGAATAFGGQGYVQLLDLVGTNVDIVIAHSSDNITFSSLIDFGSMTTYPQAARGSVANTTTVNRYLRVQTTGTFSYAIFAVAFNRNPIAGVVF